MSAGTLLLCLLAMCLMPEAVATANEGKPLGRVESSWPGVDYRVTFVDRIPSGRLLVGVSIVATPSAPPGGTLIGFAVPIPPNAPRIAIMAGAFRPRPLALSTSVMTDELTAQTYPALSPIAPPGKSYLPAVVCGELVPGRSFFMTLQFATPPPPPIPPGATRPPRQTVSFLFTNTKGPMLHVLLPPPASVSTPGPAK